MSEVECFWTVPTGLAARSLRRWTSASAPATTPCLDGKGYHSAVVDLGETAPMLWSDFPRPGTQAMLLPELYRDDPRWTLGCSVCGLAFPAPLDWTGVSRFDGSTNQQVRQEPIYRAIDGRGEWPSLRLPAGAMFDVEFHHDIWVGADGISLAVVTPTSGVDNRVGVWHPDGIANNAPGKAPAWDRVGDPRNPPSLSITPSILTSEYHGFLTAGKLVSC